MTGPDANGFVKKFERMWRDPQPETFADLFAPDGTLFHPTMERRIARTEVPDYVQRLKSIATDLSLRVRSWAASGDVVLIEWVLAGTLDGERIELEGADRFTLRGDRASEGVAYFRHERTVGEARSRDGTRTSARRRTGRVRHSRRGPMSAIPGYDYSQLVTSPIGSAELEQLKATLMFAEDTSAS